MTKQEVKRLGCADAQQRVLMMFLKLMDLTHIEQEEAEVISSLSLSTLSQ